MRLNSSTRKEIQQFFQLAIPLASAQVAQSLTGFFDTMMMGRLGATTLAGGALAEILRQQLTPSLNFYSKRVED